MSVATSNAAGATENVQQRVGGAIERLEQDFNCRIIDGRDVYAAPSRQRHAQSAVIAELTAARNLMNATTWPAD